MSGNHLLCLILSVAVVNLYQVLSTNANNYQLLIGTCPIVLVESCEGNIHFNLYNEHHKNTSRVLHVDSPDAGEGFDPKLPFKMILLGYGGGVPDIDPTPLLRKAYLQRGRVNVLTVTYPTTVDVDILCYGPAVFNIQFVAKCTTDLLLNMERRYPGFRGDYVHMIGFSMGVPISGCVGNTFYQATKRKFKRITGLEMARPFFEDKTGPLLKELDKTDAEFVDVIHTNAGFMGKILPNGHADFYVNKGTIQAACVNQPRLSLCSHLLSVNYMAESVNSEVGFWGVGCNSTPAMEEGCEESNKEIALMGEHTPPTTRGVFYLDAAKSPPYALGRKHAEEQAENSAIPLPLMILRSLYSGK